MLYYSLLCENVSWNLSEHRRGYMRPPFRELHVLRVEFDQDGAAPFFQGNLTRGAATAKWVQHKPALRASSTDARTDQVRREGGEMGLAIGLCGDVPDAALVRSQGLLLLFRHLVPVIIETIVAAGMPALFIGSPRETLDVR